jgi:hypothetical protein
VSFDVVSLFTKVPLEDTLEVLSQHLHKQTLSLIRHVLTTTYFLYEGSFYDQKDRVAMGSPWPQWWPTSIWSTLNINLKFGDEKANYLVQVRG